MFSGGKGCRHLAAMHDVPQVRSLFDGRHQCELDWILVKRQNIVLEADRAALDANRFDLARAARTLSPAGARRHAVGPAGRPRSNHCCGDVVMQVVEAHITNLQRPGQGACGILQKLIVNAALHRLTGTWLRLTEIRYMGRAVRVPSIAAYTRVLLENVPAVPHVLDSGKSNRGVIA